MRRFIILVFLVSLKLTSIAQTENVFEIGLTDGSVLYPKTLTHKSSVWQTKHFLVDGERIEYDKVKYYISKGNYYLKANINSYNPTFYKRGLNGDRIQTYSLATFYYTPTANGSMMVKNNKVDIYYVKDRTQYKKMTLTNLKKDLYDHPASRKELKKVGRVNRIRALLYSGGLAMMVGGIIATTNNFDKESSPDSDGDGLGISPWLFIGAATMSIPLFTGKNKRKSMYSALNKYNQK